MSGASELPIRRGAWIGLFVLAGLLGGEINAFATFPFLPEDPRRVLPLSRLMTILLWSGGWFGLAVGICLAISRRFWVRLVAGIFVVPVLFAVAHELTPESILTAYQTNKFLCTRGMSLEGWERWHRDRQYQWLVAVGRAVAAFVVVHHLALEWHRKGWNASFGILLTLAVGAASGVLFEQTCGMEFLYYVPTDERSSTLLTISPSGLAQGLTQGIALVAAVAWGKAPSGPVLAASGLRRVGFGVPAS